MDPGILRLLYMIKVYLLSGHVWWHMPLVLTMAYTLFVRERLLDNALYDSYPNPPPQVKQRCNDPVIGKSYAVVKFVSFLVKQIGPGKNDSAWV